MDRSKLRKSETNTSSTMAARAWVGAARFCYIYKSLLHGS